jgi:hypothetical protein
MEGRRSRLFRVGAAKKEARLSPGFEGDAVDA